MSGTNFVSRNNPFQGLLCVRLIIFYFDFPTAFVTFPSTLRDWSLLFEKKSYENINRKNHFVFYHLPGILFISNVMGYLRKILYYTYMRQKIQVGMHEYMFSNRRAFDSLLKNNFKFVIINVINSITNFQFYRVLFELNWVFYMKYENKIRSNLCLACFRFLLLSQR